MQKSYLVDIEKESPPYDKTEFKSRLGALMQLLDVFPGIGHAVSKIAQSQEKPRVVDSEALQRIIEYLHKHRDMALRLRVGNRPADRRLSCCGHMQTAAMLVTRMVGRSIHSSSI